MYALIKNNTVWKYPYTLRDLVTDNPNTSFPSDVATREDIQQAYGMFRVQASAKPVYNQLTQKTVEDTPVLVANVWQQVWLIQDMSNAEAAAAQMILYKEYDLALTNHFDSVAREKNYDNRITCALRAGYAGPFHDEGVAFATWMDGCNEQGYQILAEVKAGIKPLPSILQFIDSLPSMVWPT